METLVGADPDLVLLSNKLTQVPQEITAYQKQIAAIRQQLAETEGQLERAQQERLALEEAFLAKAGPNPNRSWAWWLTCPSETKLWRNRETSNLVSIEEAQSCRRDAWYP